MWVHLPVWVAASAVGAKFSLPKLVQDGLGHDGARRVAGAEEQNVERTIDHVPSYEVQQADAV